MPERTRAGRLNGNESRRKIKVRSDKMKATFALHIICRRPKQK